MHGRKGIELSINFFVVIVLSLAIFGVGMKLLFDTMRSLPQLPSECTDENIDAKFASSNSVGVLCPTQLTVEPGKEAAIKVGVLNFERGLSETRYFYITVTPKFVVDENMRQVSAQMPAFRITQDSSFSLAPKADKKRQIIISAPVDAPKGKYIFSVKVCISNNDQYDFQTNCPTISEQNAYWREQLIVTVP